MEKQKQDCADVHRRRRGGDDRPVVRRGAALQALLSGERGTSCSRCVRPAGVTTVCVLRLSGVGAWRHGGGRTRHRTGGDDGAGEGTYPQDHLQRRPTRQHAVELQTAADGDLCKTWFLTPRPVLVPILVLNCAGFVCLSCRWFQVRRLWLSTERGTPQINPLPAFPPTTWSPLRRDSTSTRSR